MKKTTILIILQVIATLILVSLLVYFTIGYDNIQLLIGDDYSAEYIIEHMGSNIEDYIVVHDEYSKSTGYYSGYSVDNGIIYHGGGCWGTYESKEQVCSTKEQRYLLGIYLTVYNNKNIQTRDAKELYNFLDRIYDKDDSVYDDIIHVLSKELRKQETMKNL